MSEETADKATAPIEILFRINKEDVFDKFKKHIQDKNNIRTSKVSDESSKSELLEKIKNIYEFVVSESMMALRNKFMHDEEMFKKVKHLLESYLVNKIRSRSDGTHYINVNDIVSFTGNAEQYENWIVKDKRKLYRVFKNVVDELNSLLDGRDLDDMNKAVIVDEIKEIVKIISKEDIASTILNKIPEEYLVEFFEDYKFKNFAVSFIKILSEMKVEEKESLDLLHELVHKQLNILVSRKD